MDSPNSHFMLFATEINRALFEGEIDKALRLIGDHMQKNGISTSLDALAAIPVEHHPAGENPLAP